MTVHQRLIRVPRHEKYFHIRPQGTNSLRDLAPAHPRQNHIRDKQVNATGMPFANRSRILRLLRNQHGVTLRRQHRADKVSHCGVVLHQQNRLRTLLSMLLRFLRYDSLRRLRHLRQINLEGGAFPHFAICPDVPAALFQHTVDHRQSQSRSMAGPFGSEKRFKDARQYRCVHAHPRVGNDKQGVRPGRGSHVEPHKIIVQLDVLGFQRESSALGHRVARVDAEIHQHLFELSGICSYRRQSLRQRHFDLDVFSNDPLQHLQEVSNDVVQIQDAQLKHLLPAESQHLAGQGRPTFSGHVDLLRGSVIFRNARKLFCEVAAIAQDDRQQIIEIVRDSTCQRPDGFHFLRLPELLLQFSPLCQIPDGCTPPQALLRFQHAQLDLHWELAAFPAQSVDLQGCSHGRPLRPSEEHGSVFQTFFPKPLGDQDVHRLPQQIFSPISERLSCLRVHKHDSAFLIHHYHGVRRGLHQAAELSLRRSYRFPQPFFLLTQFTLPSLPKHQSHAETTERHQNRHPGALQLLPNPRRSHRHNQQRQRDMSELCQEPRLRYVLFEPPPSFLCHP